MMFSQNLFLNLKNKRLKYGQKKIENKANCLMGIVIGNRLVLSPQINIMIRFIQPAFYASIVNKAKSGLHVH